MKVRRAIPAIFLLCWVAWVFVVIHHASGMAVIQAGNAHYHTPSPTASATATPGNSCGQFWDGSSYQYAGAGCFATQGPGTCPALSAGFHDPINFGGDNTGINDNSAAISSALAAGGDLNFGTAGTYKVDLSTTGTYVVGPQTAVAAGIHPPGNIKIECAPGVTLKYAVGAGAGGASAHDNALFWLTNGGNTVCGCDFQGAQTGSPPFYNGGPTQVNFGGALIYAYNGSYTIEDNTFERTWGDIAVATYGPSTLPTVTKTNLTFEWNTGSLIPLYFFVLDGQSDNTTIEHNLAIDSDIGGEWDSCPTSVGGTGTGTIGSNITVQWNMVLTTSAGNCTQLGQSGCVGGPEMAGEAFPDGCNYAGETMTKNYVAGCITDQNGNCITSSPFCGGAGQGACTGTILAQIGSDDNSNVLNYAHVSGNYLGTTGRADNAQCRFNINPVCGAAAPAHP